MKRYKKLGILLGVLAVFCIATVLLSGYQEKQEQIRNSDEIVLEIPMDTVTALSWEYSSEGGLSFHRNEEIWHYDSDEAFPVSQERVHEILSHFEAFGAAFIIENVEDYGQYGLDNPECTLHITSDEKTYNIRLGDFSKMDEQRYVDIGDGNVYLVKEDPITYIDASLSYMIDHDDTPGFETVLAISFSGSENYTITREEDSGLSYSASDVYFTEKDGQWHSLDRYAVTTYLNTITSLDLSDYVTYNATEEELKACGLLEPELSVTVDYAYTDEASEEGAQISDSLVLHIGRSPEELAAAEEAEAAGETAQDVSMYVRIGDSQIVYRLDKVDYGILSGASYDDLRHREVFWADFDDVRKITVTLEGQTHVLNSSLNEDEDRIWYYSDGTSEAYSEEDDLELTDVKDALNALSANSFTTEEASGKEELRLLISLENESFPEVELVFYRYSGTECLAAADGKTVSLVPRDTVMELVEAIQTIILG